MAANSIHIIHLIIHSTSFGLLGASRRCLATSFFVHSKVLDVLVDDVIGVDVCELAITARMGLWGLVGGRRRRPGLYLQVLLLWLARVLLHLLLVLHHSHLLVRISGRQRLPFGGQNQLRTRHAVVDERLGQREHPLARPAPSGVIFSGRRTGSAALVLVLDVVDEPEVSFQHVQPVESTAVPVAGRIVAPVRTVEHRSRVGLGVPAQVGLPGKRPLAVGELTGVRPARGGARGQAAVFFGLGFRARWFFGGGGAVVSVKRRGRRGRGIEGRKLLYVVVSGLSTLGRLLLLARLHEIRVWGWHCRHATYTRVDAGGHRVDLGVDGAHGGVGGADRAHAGVLAIVVEWSIVVLVRMGMVTVVVVVQVGRQNGLGLSRGILLHLLSHGRLLLLRLWYLVLRMRVLWLAVHRHVLSGGLGVVFDLRRIANIGKPGFSRGQSGDYVGHCGVDGAEKKPGGNGQVWSTAGSSLGPVW